MAQASVLRGQRGRLLLGQRLLATPPAELIDRLVVDDAVEPGGEARLPPELVGLFERARERFLHGVRGQVGVAGHAKGQGIEPISVFDEGPVKGLPRPTARAALPGPAPSAGRRGLGELPLEQGRDLALGQGAHALLHDLPALEDEQGRDGADAVAGGRQRDCRPR